MDDLKQRRLLIRGVFDDPAGREVLAWILNECGYWSMDEGAIKPELVAFANRLLAEIGIVHPRNLVMIADKLMDAATDEDLED